VSGGVLWTVVLVGSLGCYLLKLAGLSVPAAWVQQPWVTRVVDFVPAALLAALVVVQAVTSGHELVLDGRLVALAVAAIALALRAPFIVVLLLAGATGALVHVVFYTVLG
jgi:branched-subunit amino acid transport protein